MTRRLMLLSLTALLLVSCQETDRLVAPPQVEGAALSISDGAHGGGNANFFFLPPLVRQPGRFTGEFDASATPEVRICRWSGTACIGPDLATFTRTSDPAIRLTGQSFQINWKTKDLALQPGQVLRIQVFDDGTLLGFIDVVVITKGKQKKEVGAGFVPLIAGHPLLIRFRVEEGAVEQRLIAFTSTRDGDQEIWVMNADGSNPRQLTFNSAVDQQPTWSPDGSMIAFESNRAGQFDIWVMNADGSGATNLTAATGGGTQPSWSPDGTKIAYTKDDDIFVMNADGSNPVNISPDPLGVSFEDSDPSWSPDGTQIVFTSMRGDDFEIWVMNADGSGAFQVTDGSTDDDPTWSPDGTQIAFIRNPNGDHRIFLVNVDGTSLTPIPNAGNNASSPAWFPGDIIAFSSTADGDNEIFVINPDGSGLTQLTFNTVFDDHPAWRP